MTNYMRNRRNNDIEFKNKTNEINRKYKRKIILEQKIKLFTILGGIKCSNPKCLVPNGCADIRCLQFDHINGNGSKERIKFKNWQVMILNYINNPKKAKKDLQVLCANCNWIKRFENHENCKRKS